MSKKLKTVSAICLLTFCLTGCFPTGKPINEPDDSAPASAPTGSSAQDNSAQGSSAPEEPAELEDFKFTMDTAFEYPAEVPKIKVKVREFDVAEMKDKFLSGKNIVNEHVGNDGYGHFIADDGSTLSVHKNYFSFAKEELSSYSVKGEIYATYMISGDIRFPHAESELEDLSRSKAREAADDAIKGLDIKNLGEPHIYAITAEDINRVQSIVFGDSAQDKEGNSMEIPTYIKDDEFYIVSYATTYKNVSFAQKNAHLFDLEWNYQPRVNVVVSRRGVENIECMDLIDEIEEIGTMPIKYSPAAAKTALRDFYGKILNSEFTIEYDKLGLVYYPSKLDSDSSEEELTPLWQATGYVYDKSESGGDGPNAYKFVNPETGYVFREGY